MRKGNHDHSGVIRRLEHSHSCSIPQGRCVKRTRLKRPSSIDTGHELEDSVPRPQSRELMQLLHAQGHHENLHFPELRLTLANTVVTKNRPVEWPRNEVLKVIEAYNYRVVNVFTGGL